MNIKKIIDGTEAYLVVQFATGGIWVKRVGGISCSNQTATAKKFFA